MTKTTIKEQFNSVRAFLIEKGAPTEYIEFIDGRIKQVEAKNANRSNKPTKSATETAELAEKVLALMVKDTKYTATDLVKAVGDTNVSNQRMTASLNVLVNTGYVKNEKVKGKSLFSLA